MSREAIEALRAGVPNRAAIRALGTSAGGIVDTFEENLDRCAKLLSAGQQTRGQIVAGGFGSGKSHVLGYLQEIALAKNFIVSRVVISKETPMFDLGQLFLAATRAAHVPYKNDDLITAVLAKIDYEGEPYDDLRMWTEAASSGFSPLFPAILKLLPQKDTTPDRSHLIARFLAGAKINLVNFKQWLRESKLSKVYQLKAVKQQELAPQRLRFLPRLIEAAGYNGWVVLFDEAELVGRYSLYQRARSYGEIARWLGWDPSDCVPGAVSVVAITDDFVSEVIDKRRDDETAPLRLIEKNDKKSADRARIGIEVLTREQVLLNAPNAKSLEKCLLTAKELYEQAYGWRPRAANIGEITAAKSMRHYMKSWITTWDLERLYGVKPEIVSTQLISDYNESKEMEVLEIGPDDDMET